MRAWKAQRVPWMCLHVVQWHMYARMGREAVGREKEKWEVLHRQEAFTVVCSAILGHDLIVANSYIVNVELD